MYLWHFTVTSDRLYTVWCVGQGRQRVLLCSGFCHHRSKHIRAHHAGFIRLGSLCNTSLREVDTWAAASALTRRTTEQVQQGKGGWGERRAHQMIGGGVSSCEKGRSRWSRMFDRAPQPQRTHPAVCSTADTTVENVKDSVSLQCKHDVTLTDLRQTCSSGASWKTDSRHWLSVCATKHGGCKETIKRCSGSATIPSNKQQNPGKLRLTAVRHPVALQHWVTAVNLQPKTHTTCVCDPKPSVFL